jgi:hypothetical protein
MKDCLKNVVRSVVFAATLFLALHGSSAAEATPLWSRFEVAVTNSKHYSNPFSDVELKAAFKSPTGREVKFLGFYDGDGKGGQNGLLWKLRFMPDEEGTWTYRCSFSDGTPGAYGSFDCTAKGHKPGPLSADGCKLKFADGERFVPRGYYFSEAFTGTTPYWQKFIEQFYGEK